MRADDIIEGYQSVLDDVVYAAQGQLDWENPMKAVDIKAAIDTYLNREEKLIQIKKDALAEIDADPVYQARLKAVAAVRDAEEAEESETDFDAESSNYYDDWTDSEEDEI
jgi:hypothetical protein